MTDPNNTPFQRVGWVQEFSANSSHAPNHLFAIPIDIEHESSIVEMGVIGKVAGPRAMMMLYEDRGGIPSALVASTAAFTLAVGPQSIRLLEERPVKAGRHWLAASFDRSASMGIDYSDKRAIVRWAVNTFGTVPTHFPAPNAFEGQRFNWWIAIR